MTLSVWLVIRSASKLLSMGVPICCYTAALPIILNYYKTNTKYKNNNQ